MKDLDVHPWSLKPGSFSLARPPLYLCLSLVILHPMTQNTKRSCDDYFTSVLISSLPFFSRFVSSGKRLTKLQRERCLMFSIALSSLSIWILNTIGAKPCCRHTVHPCGFTTKNCIFSLIMLCQTFISSMHISNQQDQPEVTTNVLILDQNPDNR